MRYPGRGLFSARGGFARLDGVAPALMVFLLMVIAPATASGEGASLMVRWSAPLLSLAPAQAQPAPSGAAILASTPTEGGLALLLARGGDPSTAVSLLDDARAGPEGGVTIGPLTAARSREGILDRLRGTVPAEPTLLALTQAPEGGFWLGGLTGAGTSITSTPFGDAFLARVEADGTVIDALTVDIARWAPVSALLADERGGVIAVGTDGAQNFVASIDASRVVRNRETFGIGKATALGGANGDILIAGLLAEGDDGDYRESVAVWWLREGRLGEPKVVRRAINDRRPAHGATLELVLNGDDIYLLSAWDGAGRSSPPQVSKLGRDGDVAWTKDDLVDCAGTRVAIAAIEDGVVVVCAGQRELSVHRFTGDGAASPALRFDVPGCAPRGRGNGTLAAHRAAPGHIVTAGSVAGCTFVGDLRLPRASR